MKERKRRFSLILMIIVYTFMSITSTLITFAADNKNTEIEIRDEETGAKISFSKDAIPENISVEQLKLKINSVSKEEDNISEQDFLKGYDVNGIKIYEVLLINSITGEKIDLNKKVKLYLPIPNEFNKKLLVYSKVNNKYEKTYEEEYSKDRKCCFDTDKLSKYILINALNLKDEKDDKLTGKVVKNVSEQPCNLSNGGFEEPDITEVTGEPNRKALQVDQSLVPYWNTTAYQSKIELLRDNTGVYIPNVRLSPREGEQAAELNGDSDAFSWTKDNVHTEEWNVWLMSSGNSRWEDYGSKIINANYDFTYEVPKNCPESIFAFSAFQTATSNDTLGNFLDNVEFIEYYNVEAHTTPGGTGTYIYKGDNEINYYTNYTGKVRKNESFEIIAHELAGKDFRKFIGAMINDEFISVELFTADGKGNYSYRVEAVNCHYKIRLIE